MTFSDDKFFLALKKAMQEKGPAWESVTKRNGRVNGTKGMLYDNVSFKGRAGRLQSFMTGDQAGPTLGVEEQPNTGSIHS